MEKERGTKVIAIVALCVAVIGLSVGFAAFSNRLTISSSANVTPDMNDFDVNFSTVNTTETAGTVSGTPSNDLVTAEDATINNADAPTITNLKANFTAPGQSVTYSFYAHNAGEYIAYLKSVDYENISEGVTKVCTAAEGTSEDMVRAACNSISVTVKVGSDSFAGTQSSISSHSLAIDDYEPVEVKIEYAAAGTRADGDFSVEFGDIALTYSSVD